MKGINRILAVMLCALFLTAPFISFAGSAQTETRSESRATNHIVLGEIMTGTWCTWCKYAEQAFDILADDPNYFDSRLVMIEWHNNDPYSIPEEATRMAYYGGTGYPMAVFDGHYGMAGAANDGTGNYTKGTLDAYKSMIDPRPITANASINIDLKLNGNKLTAWVNATLIGDTTLTNLKVWGVLIEDENIWDGLYPIRMTARDVIFTTATSVSKDGEVGRGTGTVTLNSKWDLGKLRVVGFIQSDSTGFIMQAGISNPAPVLKGTAPTVTMNEDSKDTSIDMTNMFTDPKGGAITYFGAAGSAHINATVNPSTHIVTVEPWANWTGMEEISLMAGTASSLPCDVKVPVTVNPVNDAPFQVKALPTVTMLEGTTKSNVITLASYFGDIDDTTLTYEASGYTHVTVTIKNGAVTIVSPVGYAGDDTVTITATDSGGLKATGTFTVTVTDVNFPPKLSKTIPDVTMNEDAVDKTLKMSDYFSDVDSPDLQYTFEGNTNIVLTVGTDKVLTIAPKADWNGMETITVSASDTVNKAASDTFAITVTAINDAPVLTGTAFETVAFDEDTDYTTQATINTLFSDIDGPTLTYSISPGDDDLEISLNEGNTVTFHPAANWFGEKTYWIRVTDGQYMVQYNGTAKVNAINDPPKIDTYMPQSPTMNINEGSSVDFNIVASDVANEKQTLTYKWTQNGNEVGTNAASYQLTTDFTSAGKYTVVVTVSDGLLQDTHSWTITVKNVNRKPTVAIVAPLASDALKSDTPVTFTANGTDPDGDKVTFQWSIDGNSVGSGETFTTKVAAGTHTVKVTASDGNGGSVEATASITVKDMKKTTGGGGVGSTMLYAGLGILAAVIAVAVIVALIMKGKKKGTATPPTDVVAPMPPPQPQPFDQYQQPYDPNAGYYPPPPQQ